MKKLIQYPVFVFLADLRLSGAILAILAIAAGVGTWVESFYSNLGSLETGRAAVYDLVYDAPWFNGLLGLLLMNLVANLLRRLLQRRLLQRHLGMGFVLVHLGMILILAGAGITRWFGYEGMLHIREGEASSQVASNEVFAVAALGFEEASLPIRLYHPGPQNHRQNVILGDQEVILGVSDFWPRYERRLVPGPGGEPRVDLASGGAHTLNTHTMFEGDDFQVGGVVIRLHPDGLPTDFGPLGDLSVRVAEEMCRIPIVDEIGPLGSCGNFKFELLEFETDYRMSRDPSPLVPMRNPMVRLLVIAAGGQRVQIRLFARHPELGTLLPDEGDFATLDLSYEYGNALDLAQRGDEVVMRSSFPLEIGKLDSDEPFQQVAAGEIVPLPEDHLVQGRQGFQFAVRDVEASLIVDGAYSFDPDAPAAARLFLEKAGERVEAICVRGADAQEVKLDGITYGLRYGSVYSELPYAIFLEDFALTTYPGSDSPASYESHVRLNDPLRDIVDRPVRIWMNHPLNHRGTKHFQSGYDPDQRGTNLAVNRDPGKIPTYIGYTVISLGFLVVVIRIIRRRVVFMRALSNTDLSRNDQSRTALSRTALSRTALSRTALALLLMLCGPTGEARAQDEPPAHDGPPEVELSPENLKSVSRLIVQDFRGRMKPLDTLARETAVKITKQTTFEGRHPVEVFLGFVAYPEAWYGHPTISVKNPGVQNLLGVDRSVRFMPLSSLLDENDYTLREVVAEAHRTPSNRRDKTQQKLILFDERTQLFFGALQGNSLRIFPIPDDEDNTWQTIENALKTMDSQDPRQSEYKLAAGTFFQGLYHNDQEKLADGLRRIHDLQHKYGAAVVPSAFRINCELLLNDTRPFVKSTLPYLAGFGLLMVAFFWGLLSGRGGPWSWNSPLYFLGMLLFVAGFGLHLWGFVLRWIASARAPLSNGHESLLWVALAVALAGILFELVSRTAAVGALSSLLTAVVLGVSMMGKFDPSIGPLMPVLDSHWLTIHVTVITASYGFFGLSCLLGLLTMVLYLANGRNPQPESVRAAALLDHLNVDVMIAGIGLLTVGTLLGGVWANESWGRYWGWDPKETWALVSILYYAMILHFRWIPRLANPFVQAVGSFLGIWTIVMTYFGVNYLLMGMHSYAAGDKVAIPGWVFGSFLISLITCLIAYFVWSPRRQIWRRKSENDEISPG